MVVQTTQKQPRALIRVQRPAYQRLSETYGGDSGLKGIRVNCQPGSQELHVWAHLDPLEATSKRTIKRSHSAIDGIHAGQNENVAREVPRYSKLYVRPVRTL